MPTFRLMRPSKLFLLTLLFPVYWGCVENLITVRVYPDGQYTMIYHSEGDSSDIFDQDFSHPQEDSVWSSKITTELRDDEIVWIKETQGYLRRSTDLVPQEFFPYLRHPFTVEKKHD